MEVLQRSFLSNIDFIKGCIYSTVAEFIILLNDKCGCICCVQNSNAVLNLYNVRFYNVMPLLVVDSTVVSCCLSNHHFKNHPTVTVDRYSLFRTAKFYHVLIRRRAEENCRRLVKSSVTSYYFRRSPLCTCNTFGRRSEVKPL